MGSIANIGIFSRRKRFYVLEPLTMFREERLPPDRVDRIERTNEICAGALRHRTATFELLDPVGEGAERIVSFNRALGS